MRMRSFFLIVPIGLLPAFAMAQTPPTAPAPKPAAPAGVQAPAAPGDEEHAALPTTYGSLDFGGRWTHVDGDGARYERYRDMGDGVLLDSARLSTQQRGWRLDFAPDHMGRRDQRYAGSAIRPGQFKVWGVWDQIPMLMSRTTRTLFAVTAPDELQIENTIQSQVQTQASYLATALQLARTFELSSRRHLFEGGAEYIAKSGLTLSTNVRRINRDGAIPFGGSFGHGQVVETMAPVEHKLTDVESSAEYVRGNLLARGGYTGSWFHNENTSLTFDNPFRVTDSTSGGMRGRTSLAPSNSFIGINGALSYRLPRRSRVSIYGALGSLRDADAPLLPFTINGAVISPPLDRTETEGHAKTSSMNLSFTSRPVSTVGVDVRFRTYHYDNLTPEFLVTQRVAYDNGVSNVTNTALQRTEPFGVKRSAFDADVRFNPIRALSGGLGFSHTAEERTHRIFEETTENTYRVLVDSVGNQWFTLRSKYEHAERRGEGDAAVIAAELTAIGEQPGIRHFDIASRDRDRVTITGGVVPFSTVSFNASFAAGKDDYMESLFGLLDNHHRVYSAGVEYAPSEYAAAGLSYSFERYTSLSHSRQASNTAEFNDPSRNWTTDTLDRAHSIIAHAEFLQFRQHLDVMLFADYNRANGLYRYGTGPVPNRTLPEEVEVPTSLPDPTQLPPLRSELARGNVDLVYSLTERWGLGFSVWYEHYRVKDFSLDADALSRLDPAGALLLGYQYLPYTATTFWGRVKYKF
jgi:MtrB/PioB family decaheme-associated outer membrane protein